MEGLNFLKEDIMKKLFFALIVEDFNDVKKLYKKGEFVKSYELFLKKIQEIEKKTTPPHGPTKFITIEGV